MQNFNMGIDYNKYDMTISEFVFYSLKAGIYLFLLGIIFYKNILVSIVFSVSGIIFPLLIKKDLIKKRKRVLEKQFNDLLYSLSTSVSAGKTFENAVRWSYKELAILYPNENEYIIKEIGIIVAKLNNNHGVDACFRELASRSGLSVIRDFADMLSLCRVTGGNIKEILSNASSIIAEKIYTEYEIEIILSKVKTEQKILNYIPPGLLVLLLLQVPDYISPLYNSILGRIASTIALFLYLMAYVLSSKLMRIKGVK